MATAIELGQLHGKLCVDQVVCALRDRFRAESTDELSLRRVVRNNIAEFNLGTVFAWSASAEQRRDHVRLGIHSAERNAYYTSYTEAATQRANEWLCML
jgi:hypothetical protein